MKKYETHNPPFTIRYKSLTSIIIGKLLSAMQCVNKGQLILKCLFGVFNFSPKRNKNKST